MTDEMLDKMLAGIAISTASAIRDTQPVRKSGMNAATALIVGVALLVPSAGWVMSLTNRVSVLETQISRLSTTSNDVVTLIAEFADFRREYEQDKINTRVVNARVGTVSTGSN